MSKPTAPAISSPDANYSPERPRQTRAVHTSGRFGDLGRIAGVCGARVLMFAIQIAYVRLYTRGIGTSELGYYYFLASAAAILNSVLFIPLDEFQQARAVALLDSGKGLGSLIRFNGKILAACLVLTAFAELCLHHLRFHPGSALLLVSLSISTYAATALRRLLNNLRYWRTAQLLFLLEPACKCIAFFVWITPKQATGVDLTISTIAGFAGIVFLSAVFIRRRGFTSGSPGEAVRFRAFLGQNWPIAYTSLINLFQTYGYRLALVPLGYSELVGVYGTVTQLGQAGMVSAANVFRQVYDPYLYRSRGACIGTYLKSAGFTSVFCFACALLLAKPAVGICTKPAFVPYAATVGYGVCAEVASLFSGALISYLTIVGKTAPLRMASSWGFGVYLITFALLGLTRSVTPFTIGVPMIISHTVAIAILLAQVRLFSRPLSTQG